MRNSDLGIMGTIWVAHRIKVVGDKIKFHVACDVLWFQFCSIHYFYAIIHIVVVEEYFMNG